jgi:hypothetical protein
MNFNRQDVLNMLNNDVLTVTFTKVNGEERVMRCTLLTEYLPGGTAAPQLLQENTGDTISVWDTEVNAWRSFRLSSVKTIIAG